MAARLVDVGDARLELLDWGSGEPVVFVQTALTADELLPLAMDPALEAGYRKILYHRRGYAGSSSVDGSGSITRDAADCRALMAALSVDRAHIVGYSYSGAVGLQVAADAPASTHSLILVEPPPVHTPCAKEFRAANDRLLRTRRELGPAVALDEFLALVIGPSWRAIVEDRIPGAATQMELDVHTFFDTDLPALLDWRFTLADARRIACPVLYIGATESGSWFAEVRALMQEWVPHGDQVTVEKADHSLTLTHTPLVADALVTFLRRHPL